jgi:hypothetical protein
VLTPVLDKGKGKAVDGMSHAYDEEGADLLFDKMGDVITPPRSVSPSARSAVDPMERHVSPPMPMHEFAPDELMEDEHWLNCNPELLPPPGPYIRHLSFTNFRTIGSRRTQDEAVRGRFVTAGRLEGVIKVCAYLDGELGIMIIAKPT